MLKYIQSQDVCVSVLAWLLLLVVDMKVWERTRVFLARRSTVYCWSRTVLCSEKIFIVYIFPVMWEKSLKFLEIVRKFLLIIKHLPWLIVASTKLVCKCIDITALYCSCIYNNPPFHWQLIVFILMILEHLEH